MEDLTQTDAIVRAMDLYVITPSYPITEPSHIGMYLWGDVLVSSPMKMGRIIDTSVCELGRDLRKYRMQCEQ